MIPIIVTPENATEIVEKRVLTGKTFSLPSGQKKTVRKTNVVHVPDDVEAWEAGGSFNWLDINTDVKAQAGGTFGPTNTWYDADVLPDEIGYIYRSKRAGVAEVRLTEIDGVPLGQLGATISPRAQDNCIWYENILPDLDVCLILSAKRIHATKVMRGPRRPAPLKLKWEIRRGTGRQEIDINLLTAGMDNYGRKNQSRSGERLARPIEIIRTKTDDDSQRHPGRITFDHTEEFVGRTVRQHPVTKIRQLRNEFIYPVFIDAPDITETIATGEDDGNELQNYSDWVGNYSTFAVRYQSAGQGQDYGGVRFQSIGVGQGDTIDANTVVKLYRFSGTNPQNIKIYGDDVDDAAAWSDSSRPSQITKTTASTTRGGTFGYEFIPFDVQSIMQEIVDRASWAGGSMRFALFTQDTGEYDGTIFKASEYSGTSADPVLEIYYTAAATGNPKGPLGMPLHGPFGGPLSV